MSQREVAPEPARPHLLEIPVVWFAVLLAEWAILGPLLWALVPRRWPDPLEIAAWVVVLVAVTALNYSIRRRFIPR